ncbi:hypothetical protein [Streptomyces sp. NPDC056525]|uniref:hypothetical protein n=1 Tax=unclassified Streptomyces TaxID=2593676 RepID=UPI00367BDE83
MTHRLPPNNLSQDETPDENDLSGHSKITFFTLCARVLQAVPMRMKPIAVTAVALLALTACGTADNPPATPSDKNGAEASTATPATLSPDAKASIRAAAGLPNDPEAKARQAYLDALNAIDPRIIKSGKEDQAVSSGINQCGSIKNVKDEAKLAQTALERFTVDTRLPDIANPVTGKAINKAVHTHLCPSF